MKKLYEMCLVLTVLLATTGSAHALSEINKSLFGSVAIEGYDPVAYFTDQRPVKGEKAFTYAWKEANWRFSSQKNLELFRAQPEKYAPQFGGYCAWAVSQNSTAGIDPKQWKVVEGKLYLNYNQEIKTRWEKDIPGNISAAEQNWPQLLNE